jgi:hypothetical protein
VAPVFPTGGAARNPDVVHIQVLPPVPELVLIDAGRQNKGQLEVTGHPKNFRAGSSIIRHWR